MSRTPKKPTKNPSAELPVQPPQQRSLADEAEGTAGREMAGWDDPSSHFGSDDSDEESLCRKTRQPRIWKAIRVAR